MVTALKFHHIKKKFKKVYPTNSKASWSKENQIKSRKVDYLYCPSPSCFQYYPFSNG